MVEMTKPVLATVTINLFMVLYGFAPVNGGLVGNLVDAPDTGAGVDPQKISGNFSDAVPTSDGDGLGTAGGSSGGTFSGFFDSIGVVQDIAIFLSNIVLAPLGVFTVDGMPGVVKALLGVPLLLLNVIAYAAFLRSGS